jgi:hypothetical protein
MKSGRQVAKNRLPQKNARKFYINYHLALQLYYIYKVESLPKKEPRLPLRDLRRSVIETHRKFTSKTVSHFFNAEILNVKKAFEWLSSPIELYLHKLSK